MHRQQMKHDLNPASAPAYVFIVTGDATSHAKQLTEGYTPPFPCCPEPSQQSLVVRVLGSAKPNSCPLVPGVPIKLLITCPSSLTSAAR